MGRRAGTCFLAGIGEGATLSVTTGPELGASGQGGAWGSASVQVACVLPRAVLVGALRFLGGDGHSDVCLSVL